MIFSVQRFLEDHFERRGLTDVDQYAIRVANVFDGLRPGATDQELARQLSRVRTVFFSRNRTLNRKEFETQLAKTLRRRFPKKKSEEDRKLQAFKRSLPPTRTRLRGQRRSIQALLSAFKKAVESKAVDAFWASRRKGRLRSRPENIAGVLLAVFARGVIGSDGLVLREIASGIGFVDVGVSFGTAVLHLIELKILKGKLTGAKQLARYMRAEGRRTGWLVLIDVRRPQRQDAIPSWIDTAAGRIRTLTVNVNPPPPHRA